MRLLLTACAVLLLPLAALHAQKLDHRLGYIMVQAAPDHAPEQIIAGHATKAGSPLVIDRTLSPRHGIYLIRFDHSVVHERVLLEQLRADSRIVAAQFDHLPELRAIPDDPRFTDQWHWLNTGAGGGLPDADIDADAAWDVTTGGLTFSGDTIVVAVIDDGLDYNHEDIAANVWINHHEIAGNGIDDDENGYIDDIYGWNAYDDTPDVWENSHGLQVSGMIGAAGNNGAGITGINWNVKLMTIVGGTPESAAIAAYAYALEQRVRYNETHGEKGAFVVATNSSWGIDRGQPDEAPLWCSFYDLLGEAGILSACATTNRNFDIDVVGDLPTACPSEYMLSVTALNNGNARTFSGYGIEHVDFGAPGEDVLTTRRNNQYSSSSGTSFASPIAAGLVALLYSAPCPGFAGLAQTDPSAAALFIRDIIFMGVTPISSLENETRFGGGLNAGSSMQLMMALCADCPVPFGLSAEVQSNTDVFITWNLLSEPDSIYARLRPAGAADWDTLVQVASPLQLTGLTGCTTYEIELASFCADTTAGFISSSVFTTDGCCVLPANPVIIADEAAALFSWDDVLAAHSYIVQWRPLNTGDWLEEEVIGNVFIIPGLTGCTEYEARLMTNCDTAATDFSDIIVFRTWGCGHCIDLPYCESYGNDTSDEWIEEVIIGSLFSTTGNNDGYLFSDQPFSNIFYAGLTVDVTLQPGFGDIPFREQFRIWIDLDQDGDFGENEMLLDSVLLPENPILESDITIPETALPGQTRMRVSMSFTNVFNPANQPPCGELEFGEVEDYCIEIRPLPEDCPEVNTVFFDNVTFTSALVSWPPAENAIAYTYRYRKAGSQDEYKELATIYDTIALIDLEKCTAYEVQVRTVCESDTTGYDITYILDTDCDVATGDITPLLSVFYSYPNPATDHITLAFKAVETGEYHVALFDLYGRQIARTVQHATTESMTYVRMDQLYNAPAGLYIAVVKKGGRAMSQKFVKL